MMKHGQMKKVEVCNDRKVKCPCAERQMREFRNPGTLYGGPIVVLSWHYPRYAVKNC
jgi:hypothetical protein